MRAQKESADTGQLMNRRSAPDAACSSHICPIGGLKKFFAEHNTRLGGQSQSF
jgi:hypothetical protein